MLVVRQAEAPLLNLDGRTVGGVMIQGGARARVLQAGASLHMVHFQLAEGYDHPLHSHPDHESVGMVIEGTLRMIIDGETYVLGPGDSWRHPRGVPHTTRALTPVTAVEIFHPLREEFLVESTTDHRSE